MAATDSGEIASYLRTLAKVAEQNVHAPACTLAFGRRRSKIVRRSERLLWIAKNRAIKPAVNVQETTHSFRSKKQSRLAIVWLILAALLSSQVWLPLNVMASPRSWVSPCPRWTAEALHDFNIMLRDYEPFDDRCELHDLLSSEPHWPRGESAR